MHSEKGIEVASLGCNGSSGGDVPGKARIGKCITVLAGAVLLALGIPAAHAAELRTVTKPVPGRYIVVLKKDAARLVTEPARAAGGKSVGRVAGTISAAYGAKLIRSYDAVLRGFAVRADDRALAKLLADKRVEYVEEDSIARTSGIWYGATWGLDRIDQRYRPLNNAYIYDTTAWNVNAYVVDTGIQPHNDWVGRQGQGAVFMTDQNGNPINDGRGQSDCNGHGTHVAGTIGSTTYGVAKSVILYPVRVLNCNGSGFASDVIAGLNWIRTNYKTPAVANMSIGFQVNIATVNKAVSDLVDAGVTVVVAAGNAGKDACNYSPGSEAKAITVGATDNQDKRSWWNSTQSSNWGSCVDIFAPGTNITSTWIGSSNSATNTISGTSMAAPHVAGAAAIYLSSNPLAKPDQVANAIYTAATPGVVTDTVGAANRLVYSRFTSPNCGTMSNNFTLYPGQSLKSCDNRFALIMQSDGNLVLYKGGQALWQSATTGSNNRAVMQADGNLVVYSGGNSALWASNTGGHNGAYLNAQNDGNLVIYHNGVAKWNSKTCCH